MNDSEKAQAIDSRELSEDEIRFAFNVMELSPGLDIVGIDAARTSQGELKLIEVNRSPGFAKFEELTQVNLASVLYEKLGESIQKGDPGRSVSIES